MNVHASRVLGTLATAVLVLTLPFVGAGAVGTERGSRHTLSVADAPYYLDVHDKIPPSFRQLSQDEVNELAGEQESETAAAGYTADDTGAMLVLQLATGKGGSAWAVFEHDVSHAAEVYRAEDFAGFLADSDLPPDQISVEPAEWTDVSVGDAARTALFNVDVAGMGTLHFEMLVMAVRNSDDAALVVVAHAFVVAPEFAVADVANEIAARLKSGPPTPERTIAEAGLVVIGDLPAGWAEDIAESSEAPNAPTTAGPDRDGLGEIGAMARTIPACKRFAALLDGSTGEHAQGGSTTSDELVLDGPKFSLGPATARSEVTVYPTSSRATEFFHLLRAPSITSCLTKLYAKVTSEAFDAGAKASGKHGPKPAKIRVEVTTPRPSPVGDDRLVFRVNAVVPSTGVHVVAEQEYVRTGRAVARYTFSDVGKVSIREDVVRAVSERLAAAPGVR